MLDFLYLFYICKNFYEMFLKCKTSRFFNIQDIVIGINT